MIKKLFYLFTKNYSAFRLQTTNFSTMKSTINITRVTDKVLLVEFSSKYNKTACRLQPEL